MLLIDFTRALELVSHPDYPEAYCNRTHRTLSWCTEIAGLLQTTEVDGQPVGRDLLYTNNARTGSIDNTAPWSQSVGTLGPFRGISPPCDVPNVGSPPVPYTGSDQALTQRPSTPPFDLALASQNEFWSWNNYATGDMPGGGSALVNDMPMPLMDETYQATLDPFNPLQMGLNMMPPGIRSWQQFD